MLIPVPGCTHLKVLVPDPAPAPPPPRQLSRRERRAAVHLVRVALEVISGLRPTHQLTPRLFDAAVRIHVTARLRAGNGGNGGNGGNTGRAPTVGGPVRVDSLHTRPDGEIFGTATVGGRTHAYAARVHDGRMNSFRVL